MITERQDSSVTDKEVPALFKKYQTVVLLAMVLLLVGLWSAPASGAQKSGSTYIAAKYYLVLDKADAGFIGSFEGGMATGEVVNEKMGTDNVVKKHLAGVKYEDIIIKVNASMSPVIYQWIQETLAHKYSRQSGAIFFLDYNYHVKSKLEFFNALISEVTFPGADAASGEAAEITLKIAPEYTKYTANASGSITAQSLQSAQKKWVVKNFAFRIPGLEKATDKVSKIESITIRQHFVENPIGELRDYEKEPAYLEMPNLVVTLAESNSQPFFEWHEDFVINGNNGDDKEKQGTLEYYSTNMQKVLFKLTFDNIGIFRLTPVKSESATDSVRRVKAEMYVEGIQFDYPTPAPVDPDFPDNPVDPNPPGGIIIVP